MFAVGDRIGQLLVPDMSCNLPATCSGASVGSGTMACSACHPTAPISCPVSSRAGTPTTRSGTNAFMNVYWSYDEMEVMKMFEGGEEDEMEEAGHSERRKKSGEGG